MGDDEEVNLARLVAVLILRTAVKIASNDEFACLNAIDSAL